MMGPSPWIKTQAAGCGLGNRGPWIGTLRQALRPRREPFKRGAVVLDRVSLPLNGRRLAPRVFQKGHLAPKGGGGAHHKKKASFLFFLPHVRIVPLFPIYRESLHDCHMRQGKDTYIHFTVGVAAPLRSRFWPQLRPLPPLRWRVEVPTSVACPGRFGSGRPGAF